MARWILNHNRISTVIIFVLFIIQQVVSRRTSDVVAILSSGIYVLGICLIGIGLCKYKLAQCDKARK
jgi:hypothetical protein